MGAASTPKFVTRATKASAVVALILGLWGYSAANPPVEGQSELLRWLDNVYRTIRLLLMEGDPSDSVSPFWSLAIARLAATTAIFGALIWIFYRHWRTSWRTFLARRIYQSHYVICGLGERGFALACDLLSKGNSVVVVDRDPEPVHLDALMDRGGAFVHGDATEIGTLERAGVRRAAHMITLTDNDAVNIGALTAAKSIDRHVPLHVHLHLVDRESRTLFEESGPFSVRALRGNKVVVWVFDIYGLAAAELLEKIEFGKGLDTVNEDAVPVSVLVCGSGRIAEAVLVEFLQQGHFCNAKPMRVVVLNDQPEATKERFFGRYREVANHCNGHGLKLWDLSFFKYYSPEIRIVDFHYVVSADERPGESLTAVLSMMERARVENADTNRPYSPVFAYYAAERNSLPTPSLVGFGHMAQLCRSDAIIDDVAEAVGRRSHLAYAQLELSAKLPASRKNETRDIVSQLREHDDATHDQNAWLTWEQLPLYKRRSNLAEARHARIKLFSLGIDRKSLDVARSVTDESLLACAPYIDELDEFRASALRLIHAALDAQGVTHKDVALRLAALAETEHRRWNAFHVLDNWRYGDAKSETLRTHNCLLDWSGLNQKRSEVIRYDYKSVYQIAEPRPVIEGVPQRLSLGLWFLRVITRRAA